MKIHFRSNPLLVRYGETDQMGIVHHSNYLRYFEVARLEWLSQLGVSYSKMEKEGVLMPVIHASILYKTPAQFEDLLTIHITLDKIPEVKMEFSYQVTNQNDQIVCTGKTALAFLNSESRRPMRCPQSFKSIFEKVIAE